MPCCGIRENLLAPAHTSAAGPADGRGLSRCPTEPPISIGSNFPAVLAAARAGDDAAWAVLYRDLAGPVLGYLRGNGAPEPEDTLGEVFLQLVRDLASFQGDEAGFRAWVFTIAHRRMIDARRARARRPVDAAPAEVLVATGASPSPEQDVLTAAGTAGVLARLDDLTEEQREVLLLRLIGGLTTPEVAAVTGRSVEAVKALSKRGVATLRARVGPGAREDRTATQDPPPTGPPER